MGSLNGGHYTAFAQNFENSNWYHFDDANTTQIEEKDLLTHSAYLLFYRARRKIVGSL